MNPKVDFYFEKAKKWQKEIEQLRIILLDSELSEELKWGVPCYALNQKNIVLIHTFKDYCAILFHKGVLLKDPENILIQQTKNVQSARQIRFTHITEILDLEPIIKDYVKEAIAIEKSGKKVPLKKTAEFEMPEELTLRFKEDPEYQTAFKALTPGRQRAYLLYFSQAKQVKTREDRIEKYRDQVFAGKGYNER